GRMRAPACRWLPYAHSRSAAVHSRPDKFCTRANRTAHHSFCPSPSNWLEHARRIACGRSVHHPLASNTPKAITADRITRVEKSPHFGVFRAGREATAKIRTRPI
ncbi:TPA: hypothetical protein ACQ7U3_006880, partial [Burkholderia sola]